MYFRHICFAILLLLALNEKSFAQKIKAKNTFKVSYYNLNNLYDTIANANLADSNYTPLGKYEWNTEKYNSKLQHAAIAIYSLHDSLGADFIGLAGVENENVLKDLIATPLLYKMKYQFVFSKGEKRDGLGMAILYKPKKVKYLWDSSFSVTGTKKPWEKSIVGAIHAKVMVKNEVFDIVLCDFPNPFESTQDAYFSLRMNAINQVSNYLTSHHLKDGQRTIIMGTLSMEPTAPMFSVLLNTAHPDSAIYKYQKLVPLALFCDSATGTYFKDRVPFHFDQVLLCKQLYSNHAGWQYLKGSYKIYNPAWMLHPERIKTGHPFENFHNDKWVGGFSNHFPISFTLVYAKKRKEVN